METPETHTQSFILKIWLEETIEEADTPVWRGHITHVPSGERRYLQDWDAIATFVGSYLERMRVRVDPLAIFPGQILTLI